MTDNTGDAGDAGGTGICCSDWMSQLDSSLHHVPLNSLAIPGSHDSFSYSISKSSALGPDQNALEKALISMLGAAGKQIMCNWGRCQRLTCRQQLEAGVRYFDIRVAPRPHSGPHPDPAPILDRACAVHGLYGASLGSILSRELIPFLDTHPREVVILDFNHLYDFTPRDHDSLQKSLVSCLGEWRLVPQRGDVRSITLAGVWSGGQQVIIIYPEPSSPLVWPSRQTIRSPWPNVTSTQSLLTFLNADYKRREEGGGGDTLHVSQCVLTPDLCMVTSHLSQTLETVCARPARDMACQHFLPGKHRGAVNIVIVDYVQHVTEAGSPDHFTTDVIRMNTS